MGRGGRKESKSRVRVKSIESEDSDEDYVVEADDQSEDLDSFIGDDASEEEELEDEDWRTVVKPRTRKDTGSAFKKQSTRRPNRDDDDDDDDAEFTLDEDDTEEEDEYVEEEEVPLLKNTRKRGRRDIEVGPSLRERTPKKPPTQKRVTGGSRSGSGSDIEVGPSLRERTPKKPAHQKRLTGGSGSGSDMSGEEREHVREDDDQIYGTKLGSSRKILEDDPKMNIWKGKEKAEEKKKDIGKAVCGICLTEEGKNTVRGTLNCCDHYFCFACIFEWSKVETRCPLCKQRFISVSKQARCVTGFDVRDTVIVVPERNQVYQPSEEELQDFLNPYENVMCTECHQGGDDALMLLCDLCDSPAHTYCVGLGHEVPEGNWYCDGCRPGALGSSNSQTPNLSLDQRTSPGISNGTSVYENMLEIDLNVTIPETLTGQGNGVFQFSSGNLPGTSSSPSGMGVATVSGRRLIHEQIRRHIISNRLGQISNEVVGPFQLNNYEERLRETPSQSVQNRVSYPGRVGPMMGGIGLALGLGQGQPSTSINGLPHSQGQWSEVDRLNMGVGRGQITVSAQVNHPWISRSSVGPGIGASFFDHRYYEEQARVLKQQVQTMVRNQVKSLSLNMNLSQNDCVDILRRSSYTIMAAMQLEPPRLDTYTVQLPTCPHIGNRLVNIATRPLTCCSTCFEGFVKDVVNKITGIVLQPHLFNFRR